jgi:uncharacterized phiE125 gp8 family phage protein
MAWAPDYVTSAELKSYLHIDDANDDAQIALAIAAASRAIDTHCGRQFGSVSPIEERFYTGRWERRRRRWVVEVDDIMTTTSLTVEVEGQAITEYQLEPSNAEFKGRPWTHLVVSPDSSVMPTGEQDEVAITGTWGWTAVPSSVKQATLLQASRFFARRGSPYGVAGSPDEGTELRLLSRVDPDVGVALAPFKRWSAAIV